MHILYFVTAHGYGHGVRTCAIANEFSSKTKLTFKTALPKHFFSEELRRDFDYQLAEYDCGCVQLDSMNIDVEKTFFTYAKIADKNRLKLEQECNWCISNKVDCIVSDITPFAFQIAKNLNIPSIAVSNFTWYDIYRDYKCAWFKPYLDELYEQYLMSDNLFALQPSGKMLYMKNRKDIPVVARTGKNVRKETFKHYNINNSKKLGLIYAGNYGIDGIDWKKLEQFTDWEFMGIYPLAQDVKNYHLVSKNEFRFQDLSVSVDVIISKVGYGILSECLVNGVPLIYPSRENFAEYPVLEKAIKEWGRGHFISNEDFYSVNWGKELQRVESDSKPESKIQNGAKHCAREIEKVAKRAY